MGGEAKTEEFCARWFEVASLKPNRNILIVGKKGTGKTVLMRYLLSKMTTRFDYVMGMTPSASSAEVMRSFMPSSAIFGEYDESAIERLVASLRSLTDSGVKKHVLLLLDDCAYDKKIFKSKVMRYIFMNGRHINLTFVCLMQYVMDMPPDLRTNVDYVFALKENALNNRVKLYTNFFSVFGSPKVFSACMDVLTEDNCAIVLDQTTASHDLAEVIFWWRAKPPEEIRQFTLGSRTFWKLHHYFYAPPNAGEIFRSSPIRALAKDEPQPPTPAPTAATATAASTKARSLVRKLDARGRVVRPKLKAAATATMPPAVPTAAPARAEPAGHKSRPPAGSLRLPRERLRPPAAA